MRWPSAGQPGAGANVRGIDFTEFVGADGTGKIHRFPPFFQSEHATYFMHQIVVCGLT